MSQVEPRIWSFPSKDGYHQIAEHLRATLPCVGKDSATVSLDELDICEIRRVLFIGGDAVQDVFHDIQEEEQELTWKLAA